MKKESDSNYYVGRLRAERAAAAAATCEQAHEAHQILADSYAKLLSACGHPAAKALKADEAVDPLA